MRKPVSQRLMPLLLILLTLALDRFTKALAVALPDERILIPGVLRWIYAENTGMAFSLFSGQSWMLGVVSVIAVIAGWLVLRRYQLSGWSRTAAALMIGGALGNAYDRLAQANHLLELAGQELQSQICWISPCSPSQCSILRTRCSSSARC